jgi:PKD repeat protein
LKKNKEIEEILKEKFEQFTPDVPASVWANIESNISSAPASTSIMSTVAGKITAIIIGVGLVGGTIYMVNAYNSQKKKLAAQTLIKEREEKIYDQPKEAGEADMNTTRTKVISVENTKDWKEINSPKKVRIKMITKSEEKNRRANLSSVADMHISQSSRTIISLEDLNNMIEANNLPGKQNPAIDSITVIVENPAESDPPFATINASVVGGNAPLEVEFSQHSTSGHTKWEFGDGATSTKESPSHTYTEPGSYFVTLIIETQSGTTATDGKLIEVTKLDAATEQAEPFRSQITSKPNVFTPNGDGINDLMFVGAEHMESFHFLLLDMSSNNIVFETRNPAFKWDGTLPDGTRIARGTYVYIILAKGQDGQQFDESGALSVQ